MVKRTQLTRLVFERNQGRAIIGAKTSRNAPQKLRGPVITCDGVVQFEAPTASEPAIHLAGALWRSSVGGALLRAAVHAQGAGDTADRPVPDDQGLNDLLLGLRGCWTCPPDKHTGRAISGAVLPPEVVHFEALKVIIRWCTLSDRRQVPCFPQFAEYQARRFGTGKIRHNSLRSAFGTYSGFPCPSALSLMEGRYRISHGEMPFCMAFHEFTCPSRVSANRSYPPLIPVAPHFSMAAAGS